MADHSASLSPDKLASGIEMEMYECDLEALLTSARALLVIDRRPLQKFATLRLIERESITVLAQWPNAHRVYGVARLVKPGLQVRLQEALDKHGVTLCIERTFKKDKLQVRSDKWGQYAGTLITANHPGMFPYKPAGQ